MKTHASADIQEVPYVVKHDGGMTSIFAIETVYIRENPSDKTSDIEQIIETRADIQFPTRLIPTLVYRLARVYEEEKHEAEKTAKEPGDPMWFAVRKMFPDADGI